MWQRILELITANPNLAGGAFGIVGMLFTAVVSWLLKRPIVKQAVAADDFKATLLGYETLNTALKERVAYFENQQRTRDAYEETMRVTIRGLDPAAIDRRWRHLANNLIAMLCAYRDRLRRLGQMQPISAAVFEDFMRDGGEVPDRWYEALEIDRPTSIDEIDILLVDDNEILARRWCHDFERRGYSILRAATAAAALEITQQPRLAMIDIALGGEMDGDVLARALRDRGYTGPLLAITGAADPAKLDRDLFAEVLQKPIRFDALLAMVERHLGEK